MASRILSPASRMLRAPVTGATRGFSMSARRAAQITETPLPVRKPVGAFRGGLTGFLLGSTLAGAGVYYYILEEYKVSNELLTEDIYRVHTYVQSLEEKLADLEKKKK
ncbi:hypothetical protein BELL_0372g00070 [Botrytis elliptica]|uniref:Uncharacterized protein n=1 Tax=Botrytis elliptica TaxID=278938 RepID=A0A4Z1JHZ3_9HELO|nr:hypothetical protein BELL_0372g00070 [Botrytis elliptica]